MGTPWFDGTEGVTQCPILPGETFTYEFKVDRVRLMAARGCRNSEIFPESRNQKFQF